MDGLKKMYTSLINFGEWLQSPFLLAVRLFWGFLFLQTGLKKLSDIAGTTNFIYSLGIPFPELNAHLLAWTETIGGACLILGFGSRLICLPLIFAMIMAFATAHVEPIKTFLESPSGILKASPFTYLIASLIVLIFGPGKFSIDYILEMLCRSKNKK